MASRRKRGNGRTRRTQGRRAQQKGRGVSAWAVRLWLAPLLVLAAALVTLALDTQTGLVPLVELWREAGRVEAEVRALETERDTLRARALALKTEPIEIEALARERLGMVRPGEVVLRLGRGPD